MPGFWEVLVQPPLPYLAHHNHHCQIDLLAIVPYYLHLFLLSPAGDEAIQLGSLRKIMQVRSAQVQLPSSQKLWKWFKKCVAPCFFCPGIPDSSDHEGFQAGTKQCWPEVNCSYGENFKIVKIAICIISLIPNNNVTKKNIFIILWQVRTSWKDLGLLVVLVVMGTLVFGR